MPAVSNWGEVDSWQEFDSLIPAPANPDNPWSELDYTPEEYARVHEKEQKALALKKRIDTEPWAVANDKTLPPGDRFLGAIAFQDKLAKDSDYNPDPLYFPKKFWVVGGGLSAAETLDAKRSRDRIAKGTADDMDYWRAARYMKMLESQKNYTDAQWYADGILEIGSFVGDMLATGGVSGAAGSAAKKGATKLATKSFGAAVGKQVGTAAGMGAFTATATALNPGRVAESAATRYADQGKDPATAIAGGVGDVATEMFTEQLGGAAMKFLPKALRKKLWVNPRGLWGRSNIQGFPLEMGEETAGDVIRGVTGLSEDYGATGQALQGNLKPLAGTAALVALPGGIQAGTALAGRSQTPLRFDTTQKLPTAAEVNEAMSRPETAQAWATANPEAAARMAAIDSPSRKEWEELTGEKMRGNPASRKAFADNVREAIRQPGMTTDRQMSGGFPAENAGSGEVTRQPADNRRDPRWHYGNTPWKPEPSPESIADTVGTTPIANDPTPGRQTDAVPVEQPVEQPQMHRADGNAGQVPVHDLGRGYTITTQKAANGSVVPVTFHDGREIIHVVKDGKGAWFYRSFLGTGGKEQGTWYPTGGVAKDRNGNAWLIKGDPENDKGYGRKALQDMQDYLNQVLPHSDADVDAFLKTISGGKSPNQFDAETPPAMVVDSLASDSDRAAAFNAWKDRRLNKAFGRRGEQPVEQVTEFSTPVADYRLKQADTAPVAMAPETPPVASEPAPDSLLPPDLQNATDDELAGILKSLGGKPPAKFPKNTYRSRLEADVAGLFKQPPGKVTFPPNMPEQRAPVATVTPESANALNQPVSDKTPQPAPRNPAQEAVDRIRDEAAVIGDLQEQVKKRAMRYQGDLKEEVAAHYGLTYEQVDLPYEQWAEIRDRYLAEKEQPKQEGVADTGEIIAESLDVPLRKGPSMTQSPAAAGIASGGVSINLGGIGSWVKKWFATGGHAPKSVFNRREQYTADIAADEKAIRNKANDLKDSLRAEYGSSKLPSLDAKRTVNAALQGDAQAMASFKPRTQAAIKALREHIDQFSRRLIATGVTKGSLTLTVEENMGTYVTRSYQAHDDANWMPSEKVRLDAFNHLQDIFPSESAHQINNRLNDILQKAKGGAPVDVIRSSTTSVKEQGILKARKDIAPEIRAFLGEYNDPFINYAKSATKMAHLIASQEFLKDIRETGLGKFFFEKNDPNRPEGHNTLIAEPVERPGPSPVRLFGHVHSPSDEVKNVRPRAGMTPGELRKALVADAAAKVESEKASTASAAGVAEYNRGAIMDRARAEVEADRQQLLAPLAGLYTTPEIFEALQDMNSPQQVGWFMRQLLRGIYATKLGKVVLSPQALVRNFISNPVFAIQNGYLFGRSELGKAGSATLGELQASLPEAVRARWKTDQGRRDAAERYARLRVTGDGVHEGELRDAMAEVTDATKQAVEAGPFGMAVKGIHASVDAAKTLYRLGDDFWKIFAFESERARYKAAYEKAGRTISDAELDTLAADIVRDTWPTYSRQAKAVTLLRRNPLIAPFPSFPAEVFRTTIKSVQLAIKEMNDPATRAIGAKRFAGNVAVMTLPVAAMAAVRALLDIDDDDDEALRKFLPDWQKNADIIWLSKPKDGKAKYIDLSYTIPHSQWREPFRSAIRGESAEKIAQTAGEPFIGEELLTGKLLDLARNKTAESGREVYPEYGTTSEKFKASVKHVAEGVEPGFMTSAKRIGKGLTGYVEPSGRSYSTLEEVAAVGTGFRIQSADAAQSLSFHARNYAKAKPKTTGMFSGTLASRGTTTNEQITQAFQSSDQARQGEFKKMRDSAQAAIRLGVSEDEVRSILKANGVSAKNHDDPNSKDPNVKLPSEIDRVLKGDYEPYRLSRDLYDHVQSLPDGQQRLEAYQAASGDDESIAELHRIDVTNRADVLARDYKDVPFAKRPAWRQEKAEALQWLRDKGLTKDDVLKIYSPKFRSLKDAKERGKKHDRLSDALGGL